MCKTMDQSSPGKDIVGHGKRSIASSVPVAVPSDANERSKRISRAASRADGALNRCLKMIIDEKAFLISEMFEGEAMIDYQQNLVLMINREARGAMMNGIEDLTEILEQRRGH
ncbi:MAG: hypothetical protein BWX67_01809 [Thermotogae bacterium ADurb.Bin062]|nr:MAG: hypothetical protein BWX67_01809 [Thermotogota bacterium ADurb.Bin062]